MRRIRTTQRPHEEIEVDEAEFLDLSRQGFILLEEESRDREAPEPTTSDVPAETTAPEVTPDKKSRNRRAEIPGEAEPPRNTKEI